LLNTRASNDFFPNILSNSPYRTLADFIQAARAKPGELTMASLGPATAQHIAVEQLKRAAGINVNFPVLANFAEVARPPQSRQPTAAGYHREVTGYSPAPGTNRR
jgi:hypothetical protein